MLYFLVNPEASSGKGIRTWHRVEKYLIERKVQYKCVMLSGAADTFDFAASCSGLKEMRTVIIVGGDGTINEFLQGLSDSSHIIFGCIPLGSGNDFARGLKIPHDPVKAVDLILSGKSIRPLNIGITSAAGKTSYFGVSTGIGFDAAVCHSADQSKLKPILNRLHLGKMISGISAVRMLSGGRRFDMEVRTDEGEVLQFKNAYFAAAMNTPYEGGGFRFSPGADPSDGRLDLMVASGLPKWKVLLLLPTAIPGWHLRFKGIRLIRSTGFSISAGSSACVHTDGEHFGFYEKVSFRLRKETIRVITGLD